MIEWNENNAEATIWLNPLVEKQTFKFAVFADRDGTLLKHVDYLGNPDSVEVLPGVGDAIRKVLCNGGAFFLFTNQSGVGRGYYSLADVHACHERMFKLMQIPLRRISGYCIAPGLPQGNDPYRKPSPLFIQEAMQHVNVSLGKVHMIGDTKVDLETAQSAGVAGWLVGCGKSEAVKGHMDQKLHYEYTFAEDFPNCIESIIAGEN